MPVCARWSMQEQGLTVVQPAQPPPPPPHLCAVSGHGHGNHMAEEGGQQRGQEPPMCHDNCFKMAPGSPDSGGGQLKHTAATRRPQSALPALSNAALPHPD
jgi:hypothetical protein